MSTIPTPEDDQSMILDGMNNTVDVTVEEDESGLKLLLAEKVGGRAQMYAEAFNLAVQRLLHKYTADEDLKSKFVKVFCILTSNNCREGVLSTLEIDIGKKKCEIREETGPRLIRECFNIFLPHIMQPEPLVSKAEFLGEHSHQPPEASPEK